MYSASGLAHLRLIPAQAGKTSSAALASIDAWAHPRAGGENLIGVAADLSAQGSSPRRRGKLVPWPAYHSAARLIPAQAGKTSTNNHCPEVAGAHPRAGGENGI